MGNRQVEMNRATYWFCRAAFYLDRIPRYGRIYTLKKDEIIGPHWEYMKNGLWGTHLLDRLNLLWKYIDYANPDIREWLNEQGDESDA